VFECQLDTTERNDKRREQARVKNSSLEGTFIWSLQLTVTNAANWNRERRKEYVQARETEQLLDIQETVMFEVRGRPVLEDGVEEVIVVTRAVRDWFAVFNSDKCKKNYQFKTHCKDDAMISLH